MEFLGAVRDGPEYRIYASSSVAGETVVETAIFPVFGGETVVDTDARVVLVEAVAMLESELVLLSLSWWLWI